MRADSAVEPTRSENITVTWRRSARSSEGRSADWAWLRRRTRLAARIAAQSSDGIQQLATVPERRDAKLLQVFRCQAWKNRLVYLVLAERSLVLSEAKAPQPDHDVHDGARASAWSIASLEGPGEVLSGVEFGECARKAAGPAGSGPPHTHGERSGG